MPSSAAPGAPEDPVCAATHPDPYPYYAALRAQAPLAFDPRLKMWVAARASVVAEVLAHPACRVRPAAEPVPRAIAATAAGDVFGRLVRMNEGPAHASGKRALEQALRAVDLDEVQALALQQALALGPALDDPAALGDWAFDVPLHGVAALLGLQPGPALGDAMRRFVACLSPLSTAEQLAAAGDAAAQLQQEVRALLDARKAGLAQRVRVQGWSDEDSLVANLVGLMSQTFDATAGLVGNCIVALLQRPALLRRLREQPEGVAGFVREVSRFDPSVQNTRRFVHEPMALHGNALQPGDAVLVLLGAAARDTEADPRADVFDPARPAGPIAGFGAGRHACPGHAIARALASGAVTFLLRQGGALEAGTLRWTYRPSANTRIPQFAAA